MKKLCVVGGIVSFVNVSDGDGGDGDVVIVVVVVEQSCWGGIVVECSVM